MFRKQVIWMAAVTLLMSGASTSWALSSKPKGLTLMVVPARYTVLQVSYDLLRKRDAVLVAYQGDAATADPLLHAWNGSEWVYVSLNSYRDASFMQITPNRTVLVGDESLVPEVLIDASSWCPQVMSIPSLDTATLVNSFGSLFSFRSADWQWFASRYNLNLDDLNQARREGSWYDRPGPEPRKKKSATSKEATIYEATPVGEVDTIKLPPPAGPESGVDNLESEGRTVTPEIRVTEEEVPAAEVILE